MTDLAHEVHGTGPPLLCIMGLGYSRHDWTWTLPALSERFTTITFDNPCIGDSFCPEEPFTMRDVADWAVDLLNHLGFESAHVFGLSWGGFVAQEIAINHPARVEKLILAATHMGINNWVPLSEESMARFAETYDDPEERIRKRMPYSFRPGWIVDHPDLFEEIVKVRIPHQPSDVQYSRQFAAALTHDTADRMNQIKAPTLVIQGTADTLLPPGNAQLIADAIADARVEWLEGAGHLFFIEEPERVAQAIFDFIHEPS